MHVHAEEGRGYPLSWIVQNCMHLRPEMILRAMPYGTRITVPPVTNGTEMCWVMERGPQAIRKSDCFRKQKNRSLAVTAKKTEAKKTEAEESSGTRSKEETEEAQGTYYSAA
jgi:hypothetical protein